MEGFNEREDIYEENFIGGNVTIIVCRMLYVRGTKRI